MHIEPTPSPRLSKLLHRIGYACTVIVVLEILAFGGLAVADWLQYRRDMAERLDETRGHDGPLATHGREDLAADAIPLLALLPPRAAFANGGLRFAAMPGLGWHWYAVSLRDTAEAIEGMAVTVEPKGNSFANPLTTQFTVPRDADARLMEKLDVLDDGYAGDTKGFCMDGTEIAFERIRQQREMSASVIISRSAPPFLPCCGNR